MRISTTITTTSCHQPYGTERSPRANCWRQSAGAGPQRVLQLVDKPAWMNAVLEPIEVSDRLIKPHSAIVALRADKEHRLRFKGNVRQRALRLLDAIAKSCRDR